MQQIDVVAQGDLSAAEVHLSLEDIENDTVVSSSDSNSSTVWSVSRASLLDPMTSAADLTAALESFPSVGAVRVTRSSPASVSDFSVASRHLVTFLSRGGDVPLIKVEKWVVNASISSQEEGYNSR